MAATGIGNPAGAVVFYDGGAPRIVSGYARAQTISGGVLVFASGATGVVSSGLNSLATSDLLFAIDASGTQFNGIALQTTGSNQPISVATRGAFILVCNGSVDCGALVECNANNAVRSCYLYTGSEAHTNIGRALTAGASGGYALIDIHG